MLSQDDKEKYFDKLLTIMFHSLDNIEAFERELDEAIKAGFPLDYVCNDGNTLLTYAAYEAAKGVYVIEEHVEALIKAGASVHVCTGDNCSPLILASGIGSTELVQLLLDAGSDVNHQDNFQDTALHCAAAWDSIKVCKLLIDYGADWTLKDEEGHTPLDVFEDETAKRTIIEYIKQRA